MSITLVEAPQLNRRASAPFLTIGIPTWNRVERLQQQLEAMVPFLSNEVELLVCDNGSDDGTWSFLQQQARHDLLPIRCVRNGSNLGADVNYLRIIEAASGSWLWFIGDDDPIDFAMLPYLLTQLRTTQALVMLLLDVGDGFHAQPQTYEHIGSEAFFTLRCDRLGLLLQQVGRVLCRVAPAQALLRQAHAQGVGELHAYTMVYGPLLMQQGVQVATLRLLTHDPYASTPRWNLLRGHIGAWKTSLRAFSAYRYAAQSREVRLRQMVLLTIVVEHLANRRELSPQDIGWMLRVFNIKGRLLLLSILGSFKLSPGLSMWLLSYLSPNVARQVRLAGDQLQHDY